MVTAVRFSNGQEAFPLTTAAQNIPVFLRKSPLCRNHFFRWSKTAISSTAYGTATLKSLLPQAFAVSNVHPRPRKRLARCTLDCGFKTPESPALRGFEAERGPIRGTSLYLVLKSNGLRHLKNLPVKFGFSSKTVPATIAKKLPSQRCSQPLFNFARKWPTSAFTGESGYTLGFANRIAHSGLHAETGGVSDGGGITTLRAFRTFTNIPGPGIRTASFAAFGTWSGVLPENAESLRNSDALMRVAVPRRRGPAGPRCSVCNLVMLLFFTLCAVLSERARWGRYYYPRSVPHVSETLRGRGLKRHTLPLLGLGPVCFRRTQRASGQRCVHARRCSEASRPRWAA